MSIVGMVFQLGGNVIYCSFQQEVHILRADSFVTLCASISQPALDGSQEDASADLDVAFLKFAWCCQALMELGWRLSAFCCSRLAVEFDVTRTAAGLEKWNSQYTHRLWLLALTAIMYV